jgi:hypothetical protein
MAGPVPAIHVFDATRKQDVDARAEPGHDERIVLRYDPGSAAYHAAERRRTALRPGIEAPMPHDSPWWRRPGVRLRHDMHLWIRHDAARFVRPGFDPADVFPTLARKADTAKAAAFEAKIAARRRLLAMLREQVAELRAELKRRRALEEKYSPSQPRVPAGNPRGGQWTDRSGGQGTVAGPSQDTAQSQDADLTSRWAMSLSATSAGRAKSAICFGSSRTNRARMPGIVQTPS